MRSSLRGMAAVAVLLIVAAPAAQAARPTFISATGPALTCSDPNAAGAAKNLIRNGSFETWSNPSGATTALVSANYPTRIVIPDWTMYGGGNATYNRLCQKGATTGIFKDAVSGVSGDTIGCPASSIWSGVAGSYAFYQGNGVMGNGTSISPAMTINGNLDTIQREWNFGAITPTINSDTWNFGGNASPSVLETDNSNGSLTGLTIGKKYRVSFMLGGETNGFWDPGIMAFRILGAVESDTRYLATPPSSADNPSYGDFNTYVFEFTAAATSVKLNFRNWGHPGSGCVDQSGAPVAGCNNPNTAGSYTAWSPATEPFVDDFRACSTDQPDLSLVKSTTGLNIGSTTGKYDFVVTNSGNGATSGTITVKDVLPSGVTFTSPVVLTGTNAANWTCALSTTTVANDTATCTSTTVLAGFTGGVATTSQFSLGVTVSAAASGTKVNKAKVWGGADPYKLAETSTGTIAACTSASEGQAGGLTNSGCAWESTVLTVASNSDMSPAFTGLPTIVRPGQVLTGLTLTCTNAAGGATATSATCVPTVSAGTISAVSCSPATPASVTAGSAITCTFTYTAPGTQGGADEATTNITFTGTTGASNDSVPANNVVTAPATVIDAINDTDSKTGGTTGQTTNLATNDQYPASSTFSLVAGGTCASASVSSVGVATYNVPATGTCTVNYQVCAPAPNATTCDTATLTVTATAADMSAAFSGIPTVVRPGQVSTGLTLTCTNVSANTATGATCVPTVDVGTVSAVSCSPATPATVTASGTIVCTFTYTAPGTQGGADEAATTVTFTGTTGATNDSVASNNVVTATATVIDAVNDTATKTGGTTGQTTTLSTNDQYPLGSTFSIQAGGTCLNSSVSGAGVATYDVPATGTCTVNYQVCAPSPNTTTCDTATLTVTASAADMSAAFSGLPTVVRPGQVSTGLTLTCTNVSANTATGATCVPTVSAGTVSAVSCSPATPATVVAAGTIVCTFTYTAPGTQGGADEATTSVTFTGTTGATNDSVAANNVVTASATVIDAVDDTASKTGGTTGQTTTLSTNDQYPVSSTFSVIAGGTCANASVSSVGVATYDVPATGTCTVNYQVCAPAPNAATCDTATLTVTATAADMSAAFSGLPTVVRPGLVSTGLTLTCTNVSANTATGATCVPTASVGTISAVSCSPATPATVVAAGTIVCTFTYTAPGTQGGADEATTSVTFTGTTGATNDSVAANNVVTASAVMLDAVNDTDSKTGGATGQTTNLATNDQYPASSTFSVVAGGTCANASVSGTGTATYDVPSTGTCTVNYQVCAPAPNAATCDTATLTVTATAADMSAAFSGIPSVVRPGLVSTGLTLTCTNVSANTATGATCVPTASVGTVSAVSCTPATPTTVAAAGTIVCTFTYTAPGVMGGADEATTSVTFTGTTGATNDSVAANNVVTATATVIDAVNDTDSKTGGATAQTTNLATNDQYPINSTFSIQPGSTCATPSVSSAGVATYDVPATGSCTVNYQVCAPAPNATTCDTATLTVTATSADMSAAFSGLPTVVSPGLVSTGLTLTCTNVSANTATAATCVPTASVGTISAVSCTPATPTTVAAAGTIVCTFTYTAPGTQGGADEATTSVTFTGTTGATNDSVAANNVVTATATVIDAVNDTASAPGGSTGQTTPLNTNDQYPASSTFSLVAGGTCANASVSGTGTATYDVPATGSCTVNYQVCAPAPNATTCDTATLTVTAVSADMSAAFSGLPTVVRPGQTFSGLTLTCTNVSANTATGATCVPTASAGTISGVICSPSTPVSMAAGSAITCVFSYAAPGIQGGADEATTTITFTGTTGATNDSVAANNVVTATAPVIDAVDDTASKTGGATGQTTNLATNDQYPVSSTFSLVAGGTCANASVSGTGTATYDVPATGTCTVLYQVCAPAPNAATCDTATLTVTATAADMSAAFSGLPTVVRPGLVSTGLTLTCTNVSANTATAATCVPTVSAGTISAVSCTPATPTTVAAAGTIVCTFTYTAPGTQGGTDEPTTSVTFTGTTGATNDSVAANNVVTASAVVIDAVNDTDSKAGGSTGQTTPLNTNDQYPVSSTFSLVAGGTCANASVSGTGTATYDVPSTGSCTVNYQVCAPAPNATVCDTATLTVTATSADMSAAFSGIPSVVRPGQVLTGLTLTCTNVSANTATAATCVPTVSVGAVSAVSCAPATPATVAASGTIVCTFTYTAPGVMGGADEAATSVTFTGTTGATNDSVAANNVVTATAAVIDAVNDTASAPGGSTGQTTPLNTNDQYPVSSTFSLVAGGTCANASVSGAGVATYDVPATGTCTVNYQVCAPSPNATTCDTATLTVTAASADMSAAFSGVPSVVRPGQILSGLTLTCTNVSANTATGATCVPTASVGTISGVICSPSTPVTVAAAGAITCTFTYTAPGVMGGADEATTSVTFTGTTGATNDSVAANNVVTATATVIDAVNDTASAPGGSTGQTTPLNTNDQYPISSTFSVQPGSSCANASVSATGTATYDVPATGSCTVNYQVCAPSPNTTTCDTATLTVTAISADMSAAFSGVPTVVRPGQILSGLTLTCTNVSANTATGATCVPTVSVGTISAVSCTPATPTTVAAAGTIVCTFTYTAPGVMGGADEATTSVTFTGTTGATNDSVASNNVVTTAATMIDAVNDTTGAPGGAVGQTTPLNTNDQYPVSSTFSLVAGGTCANASVSATGTATYDVPASGSCTVNYQVCAPAPNAATCDTATLTVTAASTDMSAAFSGVPSVVRPGQVLTGLTLTCTNVTGGVSATNATCVPTVSVGTISAVTCVPATPTTVPSGSSIVCSFTYTAPGVMGGADEPTTNVVFTGTTGATNDSVPANNVVTAPAVVIDAVNDATSLPGGAVGQTTNLSLNDQYPISSTFSVQPGSTCTNVSVSGAGVATYDVPATGTCVVNYQVCAPSPNTTTCDTATLTVTALPSDMSAAFSDIPSVVRPGQVLTGLTLTCANAATMDAATAATCVPTVNVGTISGVICSPSTPTTVGAGGAIVCVFTYTAPGIQGGADEVTTSVTFTGTTGATNDSVAANNVARTTLTMVDAVDDTSNLAGGLTGQTTPLNTNDQYPVGSTFSMLPGTTCAAASVSTAGTATYNVPGTGTCIVAYQVCAPSPNITTCDTAVLTVTAANSDMAAAFTGVPSVVRPGQSFTGLVLTCTNGTSTLATSATCAPTVNAGTISNVSCTPISGTNVVAGGTIVCTFDYVAPGVQGGADEPTSSVTFTGTTGAANDSNPANNVALTTAIYLDAIDDGTVAAGGLTAQTFNVATNDEFPAGSTFAARAGSTCANVTVSASGVATFDVPGTGTCVVNYQVCAPAPNAATCDNAKLTVTAQPADMAAAFSGLPSVVRPGQTFVGLSLTCTNSLSGVSATAAGCAPTVSAGTITGLSCTPAVGGNVIPGGAIVCTFGYTAPGTQGGADEPVNVVTFTGTTGALNDSVAANNVVTAPAQMVDAVDDTVTIPGGRTAQTADVSGNDQYPAGSSFTLIPGSTCVGTSMASGGVATFDVPATGTCVVNYQVCAPVAGLVTCDTATLTVTAGPADMAATFSNLPTVLRPGLVSTGLTLTCTNVSATGSATSAGCVPTASVGVVTNVSCVPTTGTNVAAGSAIVCTFDYQAPGVMGGADEPTTSVTFTGTTGALNDTNAANNVVTATAPMLDAVNDTAGAPGGLTGQTTNLATNDQYPVGSTFTVQPGSTCANASVSGAGVATYDVPVTGTCVVNYLVCAAAPNATVCDNATLTVTASNSDMSAAFSGLPTVVRPGLVSSGLTLTCSNVSANMAVGATCVPTVNAGTISAVSCTPATPTTVAAAGTIVCTFTYTAPGVMGGADEPTLSVTFTGTTGATNDTVLANNVVTATAPMVDAVNDAVAVAGGLTGQTTNLAANDQYPVGSTFVIQPGSTCAAASVSSTGTATFNVPNTGSCVVNYQVCAPAPNATVCDNATLTVTAGAADMSSAFTNMPSVLRPGQTLTGLVLTCTNAAGGSAATAASCVPTVSAGTVANVVCSQATGSNVAAGAAITCTFDYTAPGVLGGADEPTTSVTFTGTTGALNDSVAANNVVTTAAPMVDAVNDTAGAPGGSTGQTTNLATNDQFPVGSTFTVQPGSTCANASVSGAGVATYDVPATGTCVVNYQLCAPAPNAATCDTATLTVTAGAADMAAAFSNMPSALRPGQVLSGLTLTCTNVTAGVSATSASCAPTVSAGTISAVSCSPAVGGNVAGGAAIVCTFSYTAPGVMGGADEPTLSVTFTGTTGAVNDSVSTNNVVTAVAPMVDAVNDVVGLPGGLTAQSTNLAANDQYPVGSTFVIQPGSTCAAASVSSTGTAMFNVPNSGTCTINYQVCAPSPNATVCDNATLTVTAGAADMSAAFSNMPSVLRPGQTLTGLVLTCTNAAGGSAATATSCVPTVSAGTVANVVCSQPTGSNVAAGVAITCTFDYTAPGVLGGADEPTTNVTFTGTTGALNDGRVDNNVVTAAAPMVDAVNDTTGAPGGLPGQTADLAGNDQYPVGSTFVIQPGSTCAAASVSATGVATFNVPNNGTCTVNYQVCAPSPNATVCDNATLTVTAVSADMSAAFVGLPTVVNPGQMVTGLGLVCTNAPTGGAATAATCVPTASVGTISNVVCTPTSGANLAAGAAISCSFDYQAPGTQGGLNEPVTAITFTGTTGALNDSRPGNNVVNAPATVIDALNDEVTLAGGLLAQKANVAANDEYPVGAVFKSLGGTCANGSMTAAGVATFDVAASGSCTVDYEVCTADGRACDRATLTVRSGAADIQAAITDVPATIRAGTTYEGLKAVCAVAADGYAATGATCVPTASVGTISNVVCTPASGSVVEAGKSMTCTFTYVAPASSVASVDFVVTAGAINDSNPANNRAEKKVALGYVNLAVSKTHAGEVREGGTVAYTLAVSNIGTAPTVGVVRVVDTLPAGLSVVSANGASWACGIVDQTVTCDSTDVIGAGMNAAPIVLTARVSTSACDGKAVNGSCKITNTATVSGGDERELSDLPTIRDNNASSDEAIVIEDEQPKLLIIKSGDRATAEIGDSVRYTLVVRRQDKSTSAFAIDVIDRLPAGFRFIAGTAMIDGKPVADPQGGAGPLLRFKVASLAASGSVTLTYRVRIGVGADEGTGVNTARATWIPGAMCAGDSPECSNEGRFAVRVEGGVFGANACVTGKIFVDCNNNHVQDAEELGIPGVRLVTSMGATIITDVEGKYSMCGLAPRGQSMTVDQTTLPRGSRLTTSSSRNAGDAGSLFIDVQKGELHRADFVEGSCSGAVIEQVKARRAVGETGSPATEKRDGKVLRFNSKPLSAPTQATDSADQRGGIVKERAVEDRNPAAVTDTVETINTPVSQQPGLSGTKPANAAGAK